MLSHASQIFKPKMPFFGQALIILVLFIPWPVTPSTFRPSCTVPLDVVNFVHYANVRSTLDIIWSCLFTLLICAWAIQHTNIPWQDTEPLSWRRGLKRSIKRFRSKSIWMLITIFAPEILLGLAFQDFMRGRRSVRAMEALARADEVPWTLTHARYANMGGFTFKVEGEQYAYRVLEPASRSTISLVSLQRVYDTIKNRSKPTLQATEKLQFHKIDRKDTMSGLPTEGIDLGDRTNSQCWDLSTTSSHRSISSRGDSIRSSQHQTDRLSSTCTSFPTDDGEVNDRGSDFQSRDYAIGNVGHVENREGSMSTDDSLDPYQIYPNADQLRLLRESEVIERLPDISERIIADMSKGDALIKAIALVQVSCLIISLIARARRHLAVTQLEIATLAFSICFLIIHLLFRSKPQGVKTPTDVTGDQPIRGRDLNSISSDLTRCNAFTDIRSFYGPSWQWSDSLLAPPRLDLAWHDGPPFGMRDGKQYFRYIQIGIALAGTTLGSIHCIAWSFEFPSFAESVIWRVSSMVITSSLPVFLLSIVCNPLFENVGVVKFATCRLLLIHFFINFSYVIARLCLTALVVRSLFYLPPDAFISTWAGQIPHMS